MNLYVDALNDDTYHAFSNINEKIAHWNEIKKKREEIAKAIERENPGINMSKKMAISTSAAKKFINKKLRKKKKELTQSYINYLDMIS
jgi:hypothetical protein